MTVALCYFMCFSYDDKTRPIDSRPSEIYKEKQKRGAKLPRVLECLDSLGLRLFRAFGFVFQIQKRRVFLFFYFVLGDVFVVQA